MTEKEIEEFAKILITEVRDESIDSCDILIDQNSEDVGAKRLRSLCDDGMNENFAKALVLYCVDEVLFHLLDAIDNAHLQLVFKSNKGNMVDLTDSGEMAGWYASGEWKKKFSKQRYFDDFEDLTLD